MLLRLGEIEVRLQTDSRLIYSSWQKIFSNAPLRASPKSDGVEQPGSERLVLNLQPAHSLTPPPSHNLIYDDPQSIVDVYCNATGAFDLHFRQGALVRLAPDQPTIARGVVTAEIFNHDRLEDVTITALAPLLRRTGRYLLHAAAVGTPDGALLFVGPSHSGKTTSALALLLAGRKLLASDVVVLTYGRHGILAHPTPGELSVRSNSFQLLPALRELLPQPQHTQQIRRNERLTINPDQWSEPMVVAAICFPHLTAAVESSLEQIEPSLALARLMEESVDRWDTATLSAHIDFLTTLGSHARPYNLSLGRDMNQLFQLLREPLAPL